MEQTKSENIIQVSAKVIRKDGTIEELGVIAETKHPNFINKLKDKLTGGKE